MQIVYNAFYTFFGVVKVILLVYLIMSFFPYNNSFRKKVTDIVNPLLEPVRYLLSYSVFKSNIADFSPIITYIVINFFQEFFYILI